MKISIKKELIKFVKALAHGILIPSLLAVATFYFQTEKDLLQAELVGAVYLVIPVLVYSETKVPEPAGFYVLALSYLYGVLITWSIIEEGVHHVS
jgi:hypothetical protein